MVERTLRVCRFESWRIVSPIGVAGGLVLAWKEGVKVQIVSEKEYYIAVTVKDLSNRLNWGLIGVYLNTNEQVRAGQFHELSATIQKMQNEMIVMGDFNTIASQEEKRGGGLKSWSSISDFNNFIDGSSLMDLGMVGRNFTWSNKRRGEEQILERLDRILVSNSWLHMFPTNTVTRMQENGSDHALLLLDTSLQVERSKRRFKFQQRWCGVEAVRGVITEAWNSYVEGSAMFVLAQKLKLCRHRLVQWQKTSKSNSKAEIEEILKKIEELRETGINGGIEVEELENMLENAYGREESYWKEKSRIKWLKEGDKNTKFVHQSFQSRVRRNKIWKLERNDRSFATSRADIALVAEDYFRDIFSSTNSTDPEGEFEDFLPKVSLAMNRRLLRPVSLDEVKRLCLVCTLKVHPVMMGSQQSSSITTGTLWLGMCFER
ncbi:uncharacterized protein [Arachis hypogaea]|uniref:uncharacterized protein n=1 Tax=Arachis hypogaea TaxID=3818 RepID=UPI003B2112F1